MQHLKVREDHFYAITLDVDKKENVHESLAAFVTPEVCWVDFCVAAAPCVDVSAWVDWCCGGSAWVDSFCGGSG